MDRSICRVLNTEDNTTMTITTEWLSDDDETIKIAVLREGMVPLSGQTTVARQLDEYPRANIPQEKSVMDMRNELSGKESQVQFALAKGRLSWKKKAWWKGGVDVRPVTDVATVANMSLRWLNEQASLQINNCRKQEENDALKKLNDRLVEKLHATEVSKRKMEDTLYAKFILVLNEKKKKIRHLEERLESRATVDRSAYDEDTDASDDRSEKSSDAPSNGLGKKYREPRPVDILAAAAACTSNADSKFQLKSSPESEQDEMVLQFNETQDSADPDADLFSQ